MNQELDLCSKRVEINSIGHVFCSIADVNVKKKLLLLLLISNYQIKLSAKSLVVWYS